MLNFGFKDLNSQQIQSLVFGRLKLCADSKALSEFAKTDFENVENENRENFQNKFSEFIFGEKSVALNALKRAIKIGALIYILQIRDKVADAIFLNAIDAFNSDENDGFPENANPSLFAFLASNCDEILFRASLIADFTQLKVLSDASKVESCLFAEVNNFDQSFLGDIEKCFSNERRVVESVRRYANYFKRMQKGEIAPPNSLIEEITRDCAAENALSLFARTLTAFLSFERRPEMNGALLLSNNALAAFARGADLNRRAAVAAYTELGAAKRASRPPFDPFASRFALLLDELARCRASLSRGAAADARRPSESQTALRALLVEGELEFGALTELFSNVLSPLTERARKPKVPKGTQDCLPIQMVIKNDTIGLIKAIYRKHGAVEIDTPVFELRETLTGKYGDEGSSLIYNLEDQGGEMLSLRYDLTVPLARFIACNNLSRLKRFHISKVYRRDQPNMNRGRFREFYQCDFDIVGRTAPMLAEVEVLQITAEILERMPFARFGLSFQIKVSHRVLLEAIVECAECDPAKFKAVCSAVDKLDKEHWSAVERELIDEKGISPAQCAVIGSLVNIKGPISDVIEVIRGNEFLLKSAKLPIVIAEMSLLNEYVQVLGFGDALVFDLSLARGLDYYTGLIYEATLAGGGKNVGSVAGGGRYDGLVGMFSTQQIPAIGVSIGIERIFAMIEERLSNEYRETETQVFVGSIGKEMTKQRLKLLKEFWNAGIAAETLYEENPKADKQIKAAIEAKIPFVAWIGESEIERGVVKVKNVETKFEEDIPRENVIQRIGELLKEGKK